MKSDVLMSVKALSKHFPMGRGAVLKALNGVSFTLYKGETLGMVGESGCGKSTCGRVCLGLYPKTAGQVLYKGADVHAMDKKQRRAFTGQAQMIFQDPYGAFNPRLTVGEILTEGAAAQGLAPGKKARAELAGALLRQVGLEGVHAGRRIHEFSGGQRQRIGIARALAVNPEFIVCDEPLSALDVSVQAQIVNLLLRLQEARGLTTLFIAHNLAVTRYMSTRVAVMYLGRIVEIAGAEELYAGPLHPYTQALIASLPIPDPDRELERHRPVLRGDAQDAVNAPTGCGFYGRCPQRGPACAGSAPALEEAAPGHGVACHLYAR